MPETARISMLQQLSNSQGKELIDNIKKAMVLNREADLLHVIRFMHEKNISLDDIGTHLTSSELDIAI
jgi:EAL domain-containing protein (putative c-di-GMP-specific phosphodiesterase class I)